MAGEISRSRRAPTAGTDGISSLKRVAIRIAYQSLPRLLGRSAATAGLLRLTPGNSNRDVVGRADHLCIEGRHRSANTFARVAFELANPECSLASHTHQPGNALRAVRLGVPCVVLLREPVAQGISWREFSAVYQPASRILRDYYRFYEAMTPLAEDGRLAVCRFEDAVASPQAITRVANAALGCDFQHCDYDADEVRRLATRRRQMQVRGLLSESERREVADELRSHRLFPRAVRAYRAASEVAVDPDRGETVGSLTHQQQLRPIAAG